MKKKSELQMTNIGTMFTNAQYMKVQQMTSYGSF